MKFEMPEIKIVKFNSEDIITASGNALLTMVKGKKTINIGAENGANIFDR